METLSERDAADPVLILKAAFADLVGKCGGLVPAATRVGYQSHTYLNKMTSMHHPEQPRVDIVVVLEKWAKDPVVTRAMATYHGYDLVPHAPADDVFAAVEEPVSESADLTFRAAEIGHELADAVSRGVLSEDKAVKLADKAEKLVHRAIQIREFLGRAKAFVREHRRPLSLRRRQTEGRAA